MIFCIRGDSCHSERRYWKINCQYVFHNINLEDLFINAITIESNMVPYSLTSNMVIIDIDACPNFCIVGPPSWNL